MKWRKTESERQKEKDKKECLSSTRRFTFKLVRFSSLRQTDPASVLFVRLSWCKFSMSAFSLSTGSKYYNYMGMTGNEG